MRSSQVASRPRQCSSAAVKRTIPRWQRPTAADAGRERQDQAPHRAVGLDQELRPRAALDPETLVRFLTVCVVVEEVDLKAGIVQALFALEALQKYVHALRKRVVFLWTSDEEIGSEASRKLIEFEAKRSDAVFVLEPAFGPRGLLKTERKGVGEAEIIAHGRASHAGLAPEQGVNAIEELAQQISRVQRWRNLGRGTTVAACMIDGGTRTNVIPECARAVLDLRALRIADMRRLEQRLRA